MRILGVDLGKKRIGLAVSDEAGEIAFPAGILESRGRKRDLAALRALIIEKKIGRAVVGLPIHMDGRRGPEADAAHQFASALEETCRIPVDTLDERWTSKEAERILQPATVQPRQRGDKRHKADGLRSEKRRQGVVDEMAASIILRTYLAQRSRAASPEGAAESDGAP